MGFRIRANVRGKRGGTGNILPDPSWEASGAGWTRVYIGSAGGATISTNDPRTGSKHLRLFGASAGGNISYAEYEFSVFQSTENSPVLMGG